MSGELAAERLEERGGIKDVRTARRTARRAARTSWRSCRDKAAP